MAFGEIYKYTWWGKVITGGFGAIYQALISLVGTLLSTLNNRAEVYENNTATDEILVPMENDGLLDKAIVFLTPTAYGDGVLNAIVPENGDGDFDFVRATTATRVNALGLIEEVAAGIPRIDYSSGVGQWLFEPARTNLFLNSATLATQNVTTTATAYTASFYGTGTITFSGTYSGSLVGEGANRVSLTFTPTAGTLTCTVSGSVTNAQIEAGGYATSYIVTEGSTEPRNAEVINNSGDATLFNDSEGVLYAEIAALANDGTNRRISISDGSADDKVELFYSTSNTIKADCYTGGASQAPVDFTLQSALALAKCAFRYKVNDFALWVNGFEVDTDTSGSVPTGLSTLGFDDGAGADDFYGKTKELGVFEFLTDEELEALTSWSSFELMKTDLEYV